MIRVMIEPPSVPMGRTKMTVTADFDTSFAAMPRDEQTREIERALSWASEITPTALVQGQAVAVPA
jgi:hypothetical protein